MVSLNPLSWVFPKRSKTALVLVQPHTLLHDAWKVCCEDQQNGSHDNLVLRKRSVEDIVSQARKVKAYVAYLTYSDRIWWDLARISDYIFVFRRDRGYLKLKKEVQARKISMAEERYLKDRFHKNTAIEAGAGTPDSYSVVAEILVSLFSKKGITRLVVCGGFEKKCLKIFLIKLHEAGPRLELTLLSKFIAREGDARPLPEVFGSEGIPVEISGSDVESLSKLF